MAIKADLQLPWSRLRRLRQWLKVLGLRLESEQSMRQFVATKLPAYTAKELPLSKRGGELSMTPCVFFPDLVAAVIHFLDMLHESNRLTWHDGIILESEVWLKVGGDQGGGNFKLCMQIANTAHPNATSNTIPICVFQEKDTPANLTTALGQYSSQIEELEKMTWRGKKIRVYLFGDYEFQCMSSVWYFQARRTSPMSALLMPEEGHVKSQSSKARAGQARQNIGNADGGPRKVHCCRQQITSGEALQQ